MLASARPGAARPAAAAMTTTTTTAAPVPSLSRRCCCCSPSLARRTTTTPMAHLQQPQQPRSSAIPGARRRASDINIITINRRRRRPTTTAPTTTAPRASGGASLPGSLDPGAPDHWRESVPDTEYCVLNFYHLVDLPDVHAEIEAHRIFLLGEEAIAYAASGSAANSSAAPKPRRDVRGRIYLSSQGVNCQAGGRTDDCVEYARWCSSRPSFKGLRYTLWPYPGGHAHPRLRLKHRPSLISLAGGMEALPVTDPSRRATPLEPDAWARMLATAQDPQSQIAVLDVRNDYEWDAGHFLGAQRPAEEAFCDTPVGGKEADVPSPLRGKKLDAPVMMYCTGGIRCDVYSAFLRAKGFTNLYTLEGGVQGYLRARGAGAARADELLPAGAGAGAARADELLPAGAGAGAGAADGKKGKQSEEGGAALAFAPDAPQGWRGSLFVFDDRLAVAPAGPPGQLLDAGAVEEERRRRVQQEQQEGRGERERDEQGAPAPPASAAADAHSPPAPLAPLRAAVRCQVCGQADASLPHLNCANLDCNDLFLACAPCRERLRGCCCAECVSAPRLLRPIKPGGHYASWQSYASPGDAIATGRSREGRLARRARRRELWKAKHKAEEEEGRALKREMKRAVAAREAAAMAAAADGGNDGGGDAEQRSRRLRELLERRRTTAAAVAGNSSS